MINLPRTIIVQLTVLISCIIPIYFIARKIEAIEKKTLSYGKPEICIIK
jgi:hypothetical protein